MALRQVQTQLGGLDERSSSPPRPPWSLRARVVDDAARVGPPKALVILCHGYGAPGDDLVSLAAELCERAPAITSAVRFIFPEAPLALDDVPFGGRAWWHIDMMALQMAMASGEFRRLADEVPEGLPSARQKLMGLIDAATRETGLPMAKIVLGGFSQGAMLATDTTLRLEEAPGALAVLSGTLLNQQEWRRLAPTRRGLKVVQSHGTGDPILPFTGAEALKAILDDAGCDVDFYSFRGGHGIDGEVIDALATTVAAIANA
jgi:phospholipase/carboxylesterase